MSFFNSSSRSERQLQKLQDKANEFGAKAMTLLQAGRAAEAVKPSQKAIEVISRLRELEPQNREHVSQLAGKLYNHSAMLDHVGRGAEAVDAARRSYQYYLEITGDEVDPKVLGLDRIISSGASLRGGRLPDLAGPAAMTADAKSRLAFMLAKWSGPASHDEAVRLATDAVDTYQELKNLNRATSEDFLRVMTRYTQVIEFIQAKS